MLSSNPLQVTFFSMGWLWSWSMLEFLSKKTTYPVQLTEKTVSRSDCQKRPPNSWRQARQPTRGACRHTRRRQTLPPRSQAASGLSQEIIGSDQNKTERDQWWAQPPHQEAAVLLRPRVRLEHGPCIAALSWSRLVAWPKCMRKGEVRAVQCNFA